MAVNVEQAVRGVNHVRPDQPNVKRYVRTLRLTINAATASQMNAPLHVPRCVGPTAHPPPPCSVGLDVSVGLGVALGVGVCVEGAAISKVSG